MIGKLVSWVKESFGGSSEMSDAERAEELSRIAARREVDVVIKKEGEYVGKSHDDLGELISTVYYQVRATEEEKLDFDDGVVPWINIEERTQGKDRLIDPDEIVLRAKSVNLIIDYPLDHPFKCVLHSESGAFSRWQLIDEIGTKYEEIYLEEERSAQTKTLPMNERRIMNRNQTDGVYGIWGHDLGDLAISGIEVRKDAHGELNLWLRMES